MFSYVLFSLLRLNDVTFSLFSVTNTFATIPGIAGVYITGYILEQTNYDWKIIFLLAAGIFSILFSLFLFASFPMNCIYDQ